jgi:hypothetical protein
MPSVFRDFFILELRHSGIKRLRRVAVVSYWNARHFGYTGLLSGFLSLDDIRNLFQDSHHERADDGRSDGYASFPLR